MAVNKVSFSNITNLGMGAGGKSAPSTSTAANTA